MFRRARDTATVEALSAVHSHRQTAASALTTRVGCWLEGRGARRAVGAGGGTILTEKRVADVLGDLISGLARLGEVQQLTTQHPLEL